MKRWAKVALVCATIAVAVGVLSLRRRTETVYAPGYSEDAFLRVAAGTPAAEVVASLGEPLAKGTNELGGAGVVTYWYSASGGGGGIRSYELRAVLFSNDVVVSTVAGGCGEFE